LIHKTDLQARNYGDIYDILILAILIPKPMSERLDRLIERSAS